MYIHVCVPIVGRRWCWRLSQPQSTFGCDWRLQWTSELHPFSTRAQVRSNRSSLTHEGANSAELRVGADLVGSGWSSSWSTHPDEILLSLVVICSCFAPVLCRHDSHDDTNGWDKLWSASPSNTYRYNWSFPTPTDTTDKLWNIIIGFRTSPKLCCCWFFPFVEGHQNSWKWGCWKVVLVKVASEGRSCLSSLKSDGSSSNRSGRSTQDDWNIDWSQEWDRSKARRDGWKDQRLSCNCFVYIVTGHGSEFMFGSTRGKRYTAHNTTITTIIYLVYITVSQVVCPVILIVVLTIKTVII